MNPLLEYTLPCTSWPNRLACNLILSLWTQCRELMWLFLGCSSSVWHTLSIPVQSEQDELEEVGHQPVPEPHYHPLVSSESSHSISDKENWTSGICCNMSCHFYLVCATWYFCIYSGTVVVEWTWRTEEQYHKFSIRNRIGGVYNIWNTSSEIVCCFILCMTTKWLGQQDSHAHINSRVLDNILRNEAGLDLMCSLVPRLS